MRCRVKSLRYNVCLGFFQLLNRSVVEVRKNVCIFNENDKRVSEPNE